MNYMSKEPSKKDYKVIVINPPNKEHIKIKLKELSEFLSKEISKHNFYFFQ